MLENHSRAICPCIREINEPIVIFDCDPFTVGFSERLHVKLHLSKQERFPIARLVFHQFAQIQFDECCVSGENQFAVYAAYIPFDVWRGLRPLQVIPLQNRDVIECIQILVLKARFWLNFAASSLTQRAT